MRYLDEDIVCYYTSEQSGYVPYDVTLDSREIFSGNLFCIAGKEATIDITDILSNYRYISKFVNGVDYNEPEKNVRVTIGNELVYSGTVYLAYRYSNKDYHTYVDYIFEDTTADILAPTLQSTYLYRIYKNSDQFKTRVLPHIPFIKTSNFNFTGTFLVDNPSEIPSVDPEDCPIHYLMNDNIVKDEIIDIDSHNAFSFGDTLDNLYGNNAYSENLSICSEFLDTNLGNYYGERINSILWNFTITHEEKEAIIDEAVLGLGEQAREPMTSLLDPTIEPQFPVLLGGQKDTPQEARNVMYSLDALIPEDDIRDMQIRANWMTKWDYSDVVPVAIMIADRIDNYFQTNFSYTMPQQDKENLASDLAYGRYSVLSYTFSHTKREDVAFNTYLNTTMKTETEWDTYANSVVLDVYSQRNVKAFVWTYQPYITGHHTEHHTGTEYFEEVFPGCKIWNEDTRTYDIDPPVIGVGYIDVPYTIARTSLNLKDSVVTRKKLFDMNGTTYVHSFTYNNQTEISFDFYSEHTETHAPEDIIASIWWDVNGMGLTSGYDYTISFSQVNTASGSRFYYSCVDRVDTVVAKIDECPADFYLLWQDRLGGIQSQRFSLSKYNENFDLRNIRNWQDHKKIVSNQVHPNWNLISEKLSEEEWIIYESIFVSPWLKLYSVEQDRMFDVVVTNTNYEEKTWKNSRQLLKFEINVELDKKQNILN